MSVEGRRVAFGRAQKRQYLPGVVETVELIKHVEQVGAVVDRRHCDVTGTCLWARWGDVRECHSSLKKSDRLAPSPFHSSANA